LFTLLLLISIYLSHIHVCASSAIRPDVLRGRRRKVVGLVDLLLLLGLVLLFAVEVEELDLWHRASINEWVLVFRKREDADVEATVVVGMRVFEPGRIDGEGKVDFKNDGVVVVASFEGIIDDAVGRLECNVLGVIGVVFFDFMIHHQQVLRLRVLATFGKFDGDADAVAIFDDLRGDVFAPHRAEELDPDRDVRDARVAISPCPNDEWEAMLPVAKEVRSN